jgi:regulator of protease activity HflC (stomatin/prohibitin superfamily)
MKNSILVGISLLSLSSCTIIRPGEVGVKQRLGKLNETVVTTGNIVYNPFISKVIKASSQTKNIELSLSLPSKEGLSITSQISILYRIEPEKLPSLIKTIGLEYEGIITNVFRSAAADVCAQYFAKDMHSGMRANIEASIRERMTSVLQPQGLTIEAVLMKSIQLPAGLANSIEQKLQAEQNAMRMEFVLQQEKLEAERVIIQAKGQRDAQKILSEGLTDQILKLRSIEATLELAKSPNGKIIIGGAHNPFLIDSER